jgi:hypothetical protein
MNMLIGCQATNQNSMKINSSKPFSIPCLLHGVNVSNPLAMQCVPWQLPKFHDASANKKKLPLEDKLKTKWHNAVPQNKSKLKQIPLWMFKKTLILMIQANLLLWRKQLLLLLGNARQILAPCMIIHMLGLPVTQINSMDTVKNASVVIKTKRKTTMIQKNQPINSQLVCRLRRATLHFIHLMAIDETILLITSPTLRAQAPCCATSGTPSHSDQLWIRKRQL